MFQPSIFFDTASFHGGIAVRTSAGEIFKKYHIGGVRAENLVSDLKELFEQSSLSMSDIVQGYVNIGPGSFTGIRTGLSFAKGLFSGITEGYMVPISGLNRLRSLGPKDGDFISEVVVIQTAKDAYAIKCAPGPGIMIQDIRDGGNSRDFLHYLAHDEGRTIIIEERVAKALNLERNIFTVETVLDAMTARSPIGLDPCNELEYLGNRY